jgi:hypothetical protein
VTDNWESVLDTIANDPAHTDAVAEVVKEARRIATLSPVRRVYSYEDIGKHRSQLDGRAVPLQPEFQKLFGLAMSDFFASVRMAAELPVLSAGYHITNDNSILTALLEQLREVATWSPLQRTGWTCYRNDSVHPDGGTGSWLATGMGIRAIADMFEIVPEAALSDDLTGQLRSLLSTEIAIIVEDWNVKRQWFVSSDNPITNQWMLPTEGLVRACLVLGLDQYSEEYEFGVTNFLRALSAHGRAGEFEEGLSYATFTVESMVHTARAMALVGDRRGVDHPFLKHFPDWYAQHLQPGRMGINCFDAGHMSPLLRDNDRFRGFLSLLTICLDSPVARWTLANQFDGPPSTLVGLFGRGAANTDVNREPPTFAAYERAARVNWRSSWDDNATGIWIRGGHEADQHDHSDRGHVSFVLHGKPVLIEAGTPEYSHPELNRLFSYGTGHNVLQLGTEMPDAPPGGEIHPPARGWQLSQYHAPIVNPTMTSRALNGAGGTVSLDPSECYEGVAKWLRTVLWDCDHLEVTDDVELDGDDVDIVLFRWHLGTDETVAISCENTTHTVAWSDAVMTITAGTPLIATQEAMPDCTLRVLSEGEDHNLHTCIVVQTTESVRQAQITMQLSSPDPSTE